MPDFELHSEFEPAGDQPEAVKKLVSGLGRGESHHTLLGVTGSGKTFTMAHVIAALNRPALVLSHNKTLAAQLYGEFKGFFPRNAVEYFTSYYDYYQPEAYLPSRDLYIDKDLSINSEIDKLRLSATAKLASGRRDVIVVASVSCIYGVSNPLDFGKNIIAIKKDQTLSREGLLKRLVDVLYSRTESELERGRFRVRGEVVDIWAAEGDYAYRVVFYDDEIESVSRISPVTGKVIRQEEEIFIFPANLFVTNANLLSKVREEILEDLDIQVAFFKKMGKSQEALRLRERTENDVEMMGELGYCSGIENYSRYFDRRKPGVRPYCLFDYFDADYLTFVDESHVAIPQVRAMHSGDRKRKMNLVDYGFRLPSALDNRPLTFNEFEMIQNQVVYVSATPSDYEITQSSGAIVEQIIRPTGLLDPRVEVRPNHHMIDNVLDEIHRATEKKGRVLITTLTKRMSEELTTYLLEAGVKTRYLHSEIDTLDRVEIIRQLRLGTFDVLVGVNLLREGLDLPEVILILILDADKEGFLRNETSLIQTIGRAARNVDSLVVLYADTMTGSMRRAMDETSRRRSKQEEHNKKHQIVPRSIVKDVKSILQQTSVADRKMEVVAAEIESPLVHVDPILEAMSAHQLQAHSRTLATNMEKAVRGQDFLLAARIRDEIEMIRKKLEAVPPGPDRGDAAEPATGRAEARGG